MDPVEGWLHTARRNLERLNEKRADAEGEAQCDDKNFQLVGNFRAFLCRRKAWTVVRVLFQRLGNKLVIVGFACVTDIV